MRCCGRFSRSDLSERERSQFIWSSAYSAIRRGWWSDGSGSYGADAACAICAHGQQQPRISVRLTDAGVEEELAAAGVQLEPGLLLTAARTVVSGDVTATEAFRAGRVRIQDEGSQLVAEIAAWFASHLSRDGRRVLDACAAPGGKTLILAERLAGCADCGVRVESASGMRHCGRGWRRMRIAWSAGWRMPRRWRRRRRLTWCWWMRLAAGRGRWGGIRRFGIGCGRKTWRGRRNGRRRFCVRRCGR